MSMYVTYPTKISQETTLKRMREDDDPAYEISQKFSRLDKMNKKAIRELFLESNGVHFQNALELEMNGSLSNIHTIHQKAEEVLDPDQRQDRAVLRMINKIPDAVPIKQLMPLKQLNSLQKHFSDKEKKTVRLLNHIRHERVDLEDSWNGKLTITQKNVFKMDSKYNRSLKIHLIYSKILKNVTKAIYKLDGEVAIGTYDVSFTAARYIENFNSENNFPLHHDYYSNKHVEYPRYAFVGMLSDKKGSSGWQGGDLVVQNGTPSKIEIPFQKHLPYLRYEYKLNEGLLFNNEKSVHQVTSIIKEKAKEMQRDLLTIRFFKDS